MGLTLAFLFNLAAILVHVLPLFVGLGGLIAVLALLVGRGEGWSRGDSLYFGFITALTVGYGDLRPTTGRGKFLAVVIALVGLITTGILVAVAVEAAAETFRDRG
jgi:voltage-gated potassium channel